MSQTVGQNAQATATPQAGRLKWLALAVLALAQLMIVIDVTIVTVALPSMEAELNISPADRGWVITAYTLPFAGLLLLGGRIADYAGRRRTLLIALAGFAASSAAGGAATSLGMLLTARAAQGCFAALLAPAILSLLSTTFTTPGERAKAFAAFGAVLGGGIAVGLVLGGVLTTALDWRWVMYINIPIAAIAAMGTLLVLRESRTDSTSSYDVTGALLATAGLGALVYGFTLAEKQGWSAGATIGVLAAGVGLVAMFLAVEARVRSPLLPLHILRHRGRGGACLASLLAVTGMFGVFLFVSFYLQRIENYSALSTGLAFLPMVGGVLLSSILVSRLMTRIPPRFLIGSGLFLSAIGMGLLTRLEVGGAYTSDVLPYLVVVGFGLGAVLAPAANVATVGVRASDAGAASATVNVSEQVGASLGTALLNTIAASATAAYLASPDPSQTLQLQALVEGYNSANAWGAGILAAGGVVALTLINTKLE